MHIGQMPVTHASSRGNVKTNDNMGKCVTFGFFFQMSRVRTAAKVDQAR